MTKMISQKRLSRLARKDYRQEYMREMVRGWVSHQIKTLREQRGLSQDELGALCHKPQATIGRLESPSYGRWNITSLFELADAFDVALEVRFVSWRHFLRTSDDTSEEAMRVSGWSTDEFADQDHPAPRPSRGIAKLIDYDYDDQAVRHVIENQGQSTPTNKASDLVLSGNDLPVRQARSRAWTNGTSRNRRVADRAALNDRAPPRTASPADYYRENSRGIPLLAGPGNSPGSQG
jgi:transcriptional regulator with XRE-family HTH domain